MQVPQHFLIPHKVELVSTANRLWKLLSFHAIVISYSNYGLEYLDEGRGFHRVYSLHHPSEVFDCEPKLAQMKRLLFPVALVASCQIF